MKRCPTCNQEFTDEWLTFCTQDGTSLVPAEPSVAEPPPTVWGPPPMPPSVSPSEQPTLDMPDSYRPPLAPFSRPQPLQSGWMPPPPPSYPQAPQQSLAIASLILGITSMTLGWCCYFGVLTSPVAITLGIIALVQMKNDPSKFSGRGMAIAGIVTGSLYFVLLALIVVLYGVAFMSGAFR
jgi:hypothetical protein